MAIEVKGGFRGPYIERVTKDRLGFVSGSIRRDYAPTQHPNNIPGPPNETLYGASYTRTEMSVNQGFLTVRWIYDGIGSDSDSTKKIYEMDTSFENIDIRNHPNFDQLAERFGGITDAFGNVRFNQSLDGARNPLAGVQSFYRIGGIWREIYATRDLDNKLFSQIGLISASPPGRPPKVGRDRDWLNGPVKTIWRGNAHEVVAEYWLSGRGGWVAPIYSSKI